MRHTAGKRGVFPILVLVLTPVVLALGIQDCPALESAGPPRNPFSAAPGPPDDSSAGSGHSADPNGPGAHHLSGERGTPVLGPRTDELWPAVLFVGAILSTVPDSMATTLRSPPPVSSAPAIAGADVLLRRCLCRH
ncbi:hypothetical protein [Nocardia sp. X0981]